MILGHSDRDKRFPIASEASHDGGKESSAPGKEPLLLSGLDGQCFHYGDVLQQILRQSVPFL